MNMEIGLRRTYRVMLKVESSVKTEVRKQGHRKTATPGDASGNGIPSLLIFTFFYNLKCFLVMPSFLQKS